MTKHLYFKATYIKFVAKAPEFNFTTPYGCQKSVILIFESFERQFTQSNFSEETNFSTLGGFLMELLPLMKCCLKKVNHI